jgi:hypothetical protein
MTYMADGIQFSLFDKTSGMMRPVGGVPQRALLIDPIALLGQSA